MILLGITGGTGCGKTTALETIRDLGGLCLDCDEIYHDLLKSDPELLSSIGNRFPGTVKGGGLDRKALGARVFGDPDALRDLNALTHPAVRRKIQEILEQKRPTLAAIDAIGLFESGLAALCTATVAVTAPEERRAERLMAREGIS